MTGGTGSVVAFASAADELCRQEIAHPKCHGPDDRRPAFNVAAGFVRNRRAEYRQTVGRVVKGSFLLSANGIPIAWADPRGASLKWIADVASMPCPRWAAV